MYLTNQNEGFLLNKLYHMLPSKVNGQMTISPTNLFTMSKIDESLTSIIYIYHQTNNKKTGIHQKNTYNEQKQLKEMKA